jgi:hypothetical protein
MRLRRASAWLLACAALSACGDTLGVRQRPGSEPPPTEPTTGQLVWYELDPRVLTPGGTSQVRITAKFSRDVSARIVLRNTVYPFEPVGDTWQAIVPEAEMMLQYRAGDLHHVVGRIEVGPTPTDYALSANVSVNGTVAPVPITSLGAGVKAAPHVLNIRSDSIYGGRSVPTAVAKDVYRYLGDDYDFLLIVEAVRSPNSRFFLGTRNQTTGLGLTTFDQGRTYGSDTRLQGIVHFPNDDAFDLAETGTLHELAHRWINHTPRRTAGCGTALADFGSCLRRDGAERSRQQQTGDRIPVSTGAAGKRELHRAANDGSNGFNDLELYLMGLLPARQRPPAIVFRNQAQTAQLHPDGNLQGPSTQYG